MRGEKVTASADLLKILLHYAARQHIQLDDSLPCSGIDMVKLAGCGSRIPIDSLSTVWNELLKQNSDGNLGLHLGEMADHLTIGSIQSSVMMNSTTLGSALEKLVRYHDLTTDFVRLHLQPQGTLTSLEWKAVDEAFSTDRHFADCVFSSLILPIRRLTQGQVNAMGIYFRYTRPDDASELQRFFDCPLEFGAPANRLLLQSDALSQPVFAANAELLSRLEAFAEQMLQRLYPGSSWADRVVQKMNDYLARGEKPLLRNIAFELAISSRQLQNLLKQDGVTYQVLLDDVRKETALRCLQEGNMSVCDIAFLLGFSEQSAFTHAFRRWTGDTPANFRRERTP